MRLLTSTLFLINVCVTYAGKAFDELLLVADDATVLAREFAQHISDDNLPRAARLLMVADGYGDAANAFGTSIGYGSSPLTILIDHWSSSLDKAWPKSVSHGALFDQAISFGANGTGIDCAIISAAITHNVHALTTLLKGADARSVRACVLSPTSRLFYSAAASPTPATARLFFRGGRNGVTANGTASNELRDAAGVIFDPGMWPAASKTALEAASPPVELDLLAPYFLAGFEENVTVAVPQWFVDKQNGTTEMASLPPPLPSAWGPSATATDALLERDSSTGLTPILRACESGRSAVLRRLLSLLPADASPRSDALQASLTGRGMSCAHLAAAAGHTGVIAALIERFPLAISEALNARDAAGRTPCQIAEGLGPFLAPVAAALREAGACNGRPTPSPQVGCPRVPRAPHTIISTTTLSRNLSSNSNIIAVSTDALRASLAPRGFSARAHFASGWRALSPEALSSLGLPPGLLYAADAAAAGGDDDIDYIGGGGADNGPALSFACAPPELPASVFETQEAEDLITTKVPFIVRNAYNPTTLERAAPNAVPPFTPPSADFLKKQFAGATVDTGALPYASAYGAGGTRMPVDDFINSFMGSVASSRARNGDGQPMDEEGAVDAELQSPRGADAFYAGPGANLARPPYIFDGSIMKSRNNARAFRNFSLPRVFQKENAFEQFVMGPPFSGAMPHFHGAAVNVLVVGVKLWVLVPPAGAAFVDAHAIKWFRDDYFATHSRALEGDGTNYGKGGKGGWHFIFTQAPGDLVYVPPYWGHAVLNLADSYAVALE
jgi:hypothetical protein